LKRTARRLSLALGIHGKHTTTLSLLPVEEGRK